MRTLFAAILMAASVLATPALAAMSAVNPALMQHLDKRPKKVVLLPPQVFVYELSAGGVPTRMAGWEATARDNLSNAATRLAREAGLFELVAAPALDPLLADQLEAHIGLYDRVAQSVFVYGRGEQSAWEYKKNKFDYTVGPGLAFLREQTGRFRGDGGERAVAVSRRVSGQVTLLTARNPPAANKKGLLAEPLFSCSDQAGSLPARGRPWTVSR